MNLILKNIIINRKKILNILKYNIILINKILEEILILLAKLILLFQVNFTKK